MSFARRSTLSFVLSVVALGAVILLTSTVAAATPRNAHSNAEPSAPATIVERPVALVQAPDAKSQQGQIHFNRMAIPNQAFAQGAANSGQGDTACPGTDPCDGP
ncbi:MAG: hypothetical protein NVS9B8_09900 [Candidatus Limnocylindrales bacterium]